MPKAKMFGGVHVHTPWPLEKEAALCEEGKVAPFAPERVILPLKQHVGAPCEPLVKEGDSVSVGQRIGEATSEMSAHVHASVSGRVLAVQEWPSANGPPVLSIMLENDFKDTSHETKAPGAQVEEYTPDQILEAIQEAGIVGMGGAAFPTHVKLKPGKYKIHTLLLNGAECEPMLATDDATMQTRAADIVAGCRLAMRATGATQAILGIEDNKPKSIQSMMQYLRSEKYIDVATLPSKYPEGGEKQLVQVLTGTEIPEGELPSSVGVAVINVATAAAIYDAVYQGKPLTHRICTITGDVQEPRNLLVPIGTRVEDLINACGGFCEVPAKVIVGGPMMGFATDSLEVPVIKGSGGVVVVGAQHETFLRESPCIRCNRCAEACPMKLMPLILDWDYRRGRLDLCEKFHAESCINCGCCTYVCPAYRKLAETIVKAKGELTAKKKEAGA